MEIATQAHGGIIPAYAGNTISQARRYSKRWDHPRVCGEHRKFIINHDFFKGSSPRMRGTPMSSAHLAMRSGSSPRMRGTHSVARERDAVVGIIPAYAGNTLKNPSSESRNPIIELHFNQFAKKVKRCFAIRFRPMRCFIFKVQ